MRAFLGWLRGEADHCSMAAISTLAEEDGKRPTRERESRVNARSRLVNRMKGALARLGIAASIRNCARPPKNSRNCAPERANRCRQQPGGVAARHGAAALRRRSDQADREGARSAARTSEGAHGDVELMLASIKGVGLETAEMLVAEVLSRKLRDRRAVARYGGLTGSPDESGSRSREEEIAQWGDARVRRGMIQLAWRFLMFQKESALAKWFEARTANGPRGVRKTMIVALARKLLIDSVALRRGRDHAGPASSC